MKSNIVIEDSELKNLLAKNSKGQTLAGALEHITEPEELLNALYQYVEFNAPFGAGVASLSGSIGVRSVKNRVFLDPDPDLPDLDDASYEIAAAVFEAGIAEFGGGIKGRHTHRTLALATVKAVAGALGITTLGKPCQNTSEAIKLVVSGYGINRSLDDDQALFNAVGFHAGSEILADEEMNELDCYLRNNWPSIIKKLAQTPTFVTFRGVPVPAYTWIKIHCSVETEHYEAALLAANLGLKFYTGNKELAKQWLLQGFESFYNVQQKFLLEL